MTDKKSSLVTKNNFSDNAFPNTLTMAKCLSQNGISHKIISDTDIKVDHWKNPFFIDVYAGQKEAHIYFAHELFGQKNQEIGALESLASEFTCERYNCNAQIHPQSVVFYFGCGLDLDYFDTDAKIAQAMGDFAEVLEEFADQAREYGFVLDGNQLKLGAL